MKHVCKHPPKALRVAVDYLRALGATVETVWQTKRLHLAWFYRGRHFTASLSARADNALQIVRRALRHAGFAVPQAMGAVA